jgi:hypothetical protein
MSWITRWVSGQVPSPWSGAETGPDGSIHVASDHGLCGPTHLAFITPGGSVVNVPVFRGLKDVAFGPDGSEYLARFFSQEFGDPGRAPSSPASSPTPRSSSSREQALRIRAMEVTPRALSRWRMPEEIPCARWLLTMAWEGLLKLFERNDAAIDLVRAPLGWREARKSLLIGLDRSDLEHEVSESFCQSTRHVVNERVAPIEDLTDRQTRLRPR